MKFVIILPSAIYLVLCHYLSLSSSRGEPCRPFSKKKQMGRESRVITCLKCARTLSTRDENQTTNKPTSKPQTANLN
jgi:hypothetical protein